MKNPTNEENVKIRSSIILPILMSVVEKNRKEIADSALKSLYVKAADVLMERIHADLVTIKKELKNKKIEVWQDETKELLFKFNYQGYEHQVLFLRDRLKVEIGEKIREYIVAMFP